MRMKTIILTSILASVAFAADAPLGATADQKLAAEKSRREFFQLQSQAGQLQTQLQAKATEANAKLEEVKTACTGADPAKSKNAFDPDSLSCTAKPPAPKAAPAEAK